MAYATEFQSTTQSGFSGGITGMIAAFRARNARRKIYNQTYRELSQLTNRELADLGLNRTEIRRVAFQAANET